MVELQTGLLDQLINENDIGRGPFINQLVLHVQIRTRNTFNRIETQERVN